MDHGRHRLMYGACILMSHPSHMRCSALSPGDPPAPASCRRHTNPSAQEHSWHSEDACASSLYLQVLQVLRVLYQEACVLEQDVARLDLVPAADDSRHHACHPRHAPHISQPPQKQTQVLPPATIPATHSSLLQRGSVHGCCARVGTYSLTTTDAYS